jgi:hypothetical protein
MIDHCSVSWSIDECLSVLGNKNTTVQWCLVAQSLVAAGHSKGNHGYGGNWGGSGASFHHNLLAHHGSRTPRLGPRPTTQLDERMDMRNNVIYNFGGNGCYGGEGMNVNIVNNYYKPGPATPVNSYFMQLSKARKGKTLTGPSLWFFSGNKMEGNKAVTKDNWLGVDNQTGFELKDMQSSKTVYPSKFHPASNAFDYDVYKTPVESADKAYKRVLAKAGTVRRDAVERRVVDEVKNGTARYRGTQGSAGFIDSPADAEGWPVYAQVAPVVDNDHDGMDDAWELKNGLDPNNPDDRNKVLSKEGYTALEVYLNGLMNE